MTRRSKIILLGSLYITQFLPLGFFTEAFPVFLREQGYSLQLIGTVHLLLLPWMVKFLWAPFVDKFGHTRLGHYRTWILTMQVLSALCIFGIAFLDFNQSIAIILGLVLLLSIFSSTQDIATDALAVEMLKKSEQGIGNGIQSSSHYLGAMLGGGVLLILIYKAGWNISVMFLALLVFLPLIPVLLHKEKVKKPEVKPELLSPLKFFKRPGNMKWLAVLFILPLGAGMADFIYKPFLVDMGYSLEEIGFVRGIFGLSAAFVGALTGGFLVKSYGRKRLIVNFAILQGVSILLFFIPLYFINTLPVVIVVSVIPKFFVGMFTTAMFTLIMERSKVGTAGTDFTVQIAVMTFSAHGIASPLSGFLAGGLGYGIMYGVAFLVAIGAVWILHKALGNDEEEEFSGGEGEVISETGLGGSVERIGKLESS